MRDQQSGASSSAPKCDSRQAQRARSFWDASYNDCDFDGAVGSSSTHTEWIVSPREVLRFLPTLRGNMRTFRVLEVGCGDSLLGEAIYDHLTRLAANEREGGAKGVAEEPIVSVVCTDISPVAIERLAARQEQEDSERRQRPGLEYLVADATDLPATFGVTSDGMFDVVVDKGCADTFQFRAKTNESDGLLRRLFHSIHAVLRPGGSYLVVTPRRKVKHLRSWCSDSGTSKCSARLGWALQRRHDLGIQDSGELKKKPTKKKEATIPYDTGADDDHEAVVGGSGGHRVYLHECLKATAEQEIAAEAAAAAAAAAAGGGGGGGGGGGEGGGERGETGEGEVVIGDGVRYRDDGLVTRCKGCGLERAKSRYKNTKSWSGHLAWCQVPR